MFKNKIKLSQELKKFKTLLLSKDIDLRTKNRKYWISDTNVMNLINNSNSDLISWLPGKYFNQSNATIMDDIMYYPIDSLCEFFKMSVNDVDLIEINKHSEFKTQYQRILGNNPHYVIDYHRLFKWDKTFTYSNKVNILVEIIDNIFDPIQRRGFSNYRYKNEYIDITCEYFIDLAIPLMIFIDKNLTTEQNMLLQLFGFQILNINSNDWNTNKFMNFEYIKAYINKYSLLIFIKNLSEKSDIKTIIDTFGKSALVNHSSGFPFSLKKTLELFGLKSTDAKYNEILNKFDNLVDIDDKGNNDNGSVISLCDSNDSDSDSVTDEYNSFTSDNSSLDEAHKENTISSDIFIEGTHYKYVNDEIYIDYNTLIYLGAYAGTKISRICIDKMWNLVKYIDEITKTLNDNIETELKNINKNKFRDMIKFKKLTEKNKKDESNSEYDIDNEMLKAELEMVSIENEELENKCNKLESKFKKLTNNYNSLFDAYKTTYSNFKNQAKTFEMTDNEKN